MSLRPSNATLILSMRSDACICLFSVSKLVGWIGKAEPACHHYHPDSLGIKTRLLGRV